MIHASLEITRPFWASAEKIFDSFLDPNLAVRFLFATNHGEMIKAEIQPVIGGQFNFVEMRDGVEWEHFGEYLLINRPHHLSFTLTIPLLYQQHTRVDISINPILDGCELTLLHTFDAQYLEQKNVLEARWNFILDKLAQLEGITGLYE